MESKVNKSFCVMPWIHSHVDSSGKRRLCCMADAPEERYANLELEDFRKSDYLKSVRKQMMSGVLPKECHLCSIPNVPDNKKDIHNKNYSDQVSEIFRRTDSDGNSDIEIKFLDYRNYICNLKCKMCSPSASSSFDNLVKKQSKETLKLIFKKEELADFDDVSKKFKNIYLEEFKKISSKGNLDRVYFAGGEPLHEPSHFELLSYLIENKSSQKIILNYNTNLMITESKLLAWVALLEKFREVVLCISMDGTGDVLEYIRTGSSFEKIDRNISLLKKHLISGVLLLDKTVTSLNVFFLESFAEYLLAKKIKGLARFMIQSEHAQYLRVECVPLFIRNKIVKRWQAYFNAKSEEEKFYLYEIDAFVKMLMDYDVWELDKIEDFKLRTEAYELMFSEPKGRFFSLLKEDALGKEWFDSIAISNSK